MLFLVPFLKVNMKFAGVWPESESFNDRGLGPVPKKFKGTCVPGEKFSSANCNRYGTR